MATNLQGGGERGKPRASFLIEPAELEREMALGDVLVVDTSKRPEYDRRHIPGAVHLSTYSNFVPDTTAPGMSAFAADMASRHGAVGASRGRPVVVYENDTGMRATRALWILEYLGHRNARLLHGGLDAWVGAGGPVTAHAPGIQRAEFVPEVASGVLMSADEINDRIGARDLTVLDVRDADEYAGRDQTPCCARRGHVPGAVWIAWTEFLQDGRFKSPEEIRKLLASRGVTEGSELTPYCHRGARSANAYYALRHAGIERVRNFIGSWHEWSARTHLPVEITPRA